MSKRIRAFYVNYPLALTLLDAEIAYVFCEDFEEGVQMLANRIADDQGWEVETTDFEENKAVVHFDEETIIINTWGKEAEVHVLGLDTPIDLNKILSGDISF